MEQVRVHCDALGGIVEVPARPQRVVSFVAGLTEAMVEMGHREQIAGVSAYCHRYVPDLEAPVVGDYLTADENLLRELSPDLVLVTTGIQRRLARHLQRIGLPVYAFPLPSTVHGVLENVVLLGGLLGDAAAGRRLAQWWLGELEETRRRASASLPRVYSELWFGRHARVPGGLSFVSDIIHYAGGDNVYGGEARAYMTLDPADVPNRKPDVWLLFWEPEHPVDGEVLRRERGWDKELGRLRLIEATVEPEHNVIHDGPSMVRAVRWLSERLHECA